MTEAKATKAIAEKLEAFKIRKGQIALLKKELDALEETLVAFLDSKEAETLLSTDGKAIVATLSVRGGNLRFDVESFKESHPKLFEKFQKEGKTYRVFSAK